MFFPQKDKLLLSLLLSGLYSLVFLSEIFPDYSKISTHTHAQAYMHTHVLSPFSSYDSLYNILYIYMYYLFCFVVSPNRYELHGTRNFYFVP